MLRILSLQWFRPNSHSSNVLDPLVDVTRVGSTRSTAKLDVRPEWRKCNRKGLFEGVCLAQKGVADDSKVVASISNKRRQRRVFLVKVNGVSRHFLVASRSDIMVVEQSDAK